MEFATTGLVAGLLFALNLPVAPIQSHWLILLVSTGLVFIVSFNRFHAQLRQFLIGLLSGLILASIYCNEFYKEQEAHWYSRSVVIVAVVKNDIINRVPDNNSQTYTKLLLQPLSIDGKALSSGLYNRYILSGTSSQKVLLQKGDHIRFRAKLHRPLGYENEFGFNYARWAFAKHIVAKAKVQSDIEVLRVGNSMSQKLVNKLFTLTKGMNNRAYIFPLLLAENQLLTPEQKRELQKLGLSHLFAISGLHIGILFLFIKVLLTCASVLWQAENKGQWINLLALSCVLFFVFMIDYSPSAVRALTMLSIWLLCQRCNLNLGNSALFCTMIFITLMLNPVAIFDVSWWLSISAVVGIFAFNSRYVSNRIGISAYLIQAVQFQLFISIWMIPLTLYWFGGMSLTGIWLNVLLVPVFCMLLIPWLFLSVFILVMGAEYLSTEMFYLFDFAFDYVHTLTNLVLVESSWLDFPAGLAAYSSAMLFLFLFSELFSSAYYLVLATCSLICFLMLHHGAKDQLLTVMVLDVGQGTSVLFKKNNRAVVYDLGPIYSNGTSATEQVVYPNLLGNGVVKLDRVMISHSDSDHRGDIRALNAYVRSVPNTGCPYHNWTWQGVVFEPIWPPVRNSKTIGGNNDNSCVVKVTDGLSKKSVLLTGDISSKVERLLIEQNKLKLRVDVLISAHHGSKRSSSYGFLKAVDPKLIIHSAGVFNRFGFPSKQVLLKGQNLHIEQLSTSNWGCVQVHLDEKSDEISFETALNKLSPFWKKQNPFSIQGEIR